MLRRLGIIAAIVVVGAALGWGALWATSIEPLLPMREGETACFAARFEGRELQVKDWSKAYVEPSPHIVDGKAVMRRMPGDLGGKGVRGFKLALTYDSRKADYDWIYNFHLAADVDGFDAPMTAAGECPWYRPPAPGTGGPDLYCGIDCDGGVISVWRAPARRAVSIVFDPRLPLRMKLGCGGGGPYLVSTRASEPGFRLEQVAVGECQALLKRE